MSAAETCGAHYEPHPTKPELVAVCTLPPGHDGDHNNLLPKRHGVNEGAVR